ncbi:MAG TPA: multiheme c-type cytochrome [Spirochaetota bacterium]|mgnify:CR=1 FL=1|nr:cytochrome C [Spirochaetota bacterium]HQO39504.1 multiheme c-type cytochrome [Spirochaetota bacterium]
MGRKGVFFVISFLLAAAGLSLFASGVDHSKFAELNRSFSKPEDVTAACLKCHNNVASDIMKTNHWLWTRKTDKMPGREGKTVDVGKKNVINNFCIAVTSNEPRCTSCHIGYGWKDGKFDFTDQNKIDCIVCHDTTGTYEKFPTGAGYPVAKDTVFPASKKLFKKPDYKKIATTVGKPGKQTCGSCHFYGGGGHAVKHGALDKSLLDPSKEIDVHMSKDGGGMACIDCHVSENHDIKGQLYTVSVENKDRISCERCHTRYPHTQTLFVENQPDRSYDIFKNRLYKREKPVDNFTHRVLDKHTEKIACQTCHIKFYSTKFKTKTWWDWSKAGEKTPEGKPKVVKDDEGYPVYDGMKGEFKLAKNAEPEYFWFNGQSDKILVGDKIDPDKRPLQINRITGECGGADSKIWPFKVMRGKQLYDPENKTLVIPKLFGPKGSGAYWSDWDWLKASETGMREAGVPFSGKLDWIETEMYWPLTHLVTPSENAVSCDDCHSRKGRLNNVQACWIPGRDRSLVLDILGYLLVAGSFAGVIVHGTMRHVSSKKRKED